jgi:hypothetical protein
MYYAPCFTLDTHQMCFAICFNLDPHQIRSAKYFILDSDHYFVKYTVKPDLNTINLGDTASIVTDILWYQLIPQC